MNPTRATEPRSVAGLFDGVCKLAFNLRVHAFKLRLNHSREAPCGLIELYSPCPHPLPTLIHLRTHKRSGAIKNKSARWSVSAWNCSSRTQSFLGYRYRPPPRQEGFKDGPQERGPLSPPPCKSELCSRPRQHNRLIRG